MKQKAYLVLSIGDLSRLLRRARKSAHAQGIRGRKSGKYCIVFNNIAVSDVEGILQISSVDINNPKHHAFA